MSRKKVYTICGMCSVRCPIQAEAEYGQIRLLQGNPHVPAMRGGLCPRGAAGAALVNDFDRPRYPLIREGERGQGQWRPASWEEALDFTARRLLQIRAAHGARSLAFSDRGGPFQDLHQAFVRGWGSPNYTNHDASCARNVEHACISLTGLGRKDLVYDLKNARRVVLQFRNIFEAVDVQEVNNLLEAMENGCRLTVIDIRATVSAAKAHRFFLIRPGTDYAFNLAVIQELLADRLYDAASAARWIQDLNRLEDFVRPYTPEWAERETGLSAVELRHFVRDLAAAAPAVIWHPGWMMARYRHSFYLSRSIYIINALLGSLGSQGGLPLANKPAQVGRSGLKALADLFPASEEKRADGAGWKYPHITRGTGLAHLLYQAMDREDPYPIKAYLAYRHDPLMGFPEPERLKRIFAKLDLLVSVTFSWSDTAWFSDVILPLSPYLERDSLIGCKNGLKPYFFRRQQVVEPRFDTRADWEILGGLAGRLGLTALSFGHIREIWDYQLQGTGVHPEDFEATGIVPLSDKPVYRQIQSDDFKTPSRKIEIVSDKLEKAGIPSLQPYEPVPGPPPGHFRLTFGRCVLHTQGHTANNPLLFEQMPENVLWINETAAENLDIVDGDLVQVSQNNYSETIRAKVTDLIHPEAVFVIHGFGHTLPVEKMAFRQGLADNKFMGGGLDIWDRAGGALALQEHFVTISKIRPKGGIDVT